LGIFFEEILEIFFREVLKISDAGFFATEDTERGHRGHGGQNDSMPSPVISINFISMNYNPFPSRQTSLSAGRASQNSVSALCVLCDNSDF
jgi:hypothetical protein